MSSGEVAVPGTDAVTPPGSTVSRARVLGVDLGGTTAKFAVLDPQSGGLVDETFSGRVPTPRGGAEAALDLVGDLVADICERTPISGVGVAVPGIVDEAAEMAITSVNLGWSQVPFAALLRQRLSIPVTLSHDVRSGGRAERALGAGRGVDDLMFVPVGTGIAAALTINGQSYPGSGWAGEIGHLDAGHPRRCGCGLRGCLEAIASGSAIAQRYQEASGVEASGAREVADRAGAGDPVAHGVWRDAVDALAGVLTGAAALLNPTRIIIGGGVALADDDLFIDPLVRAVRARRGWQPAPEIVRAELGDRAGCIGAALACPQWEGQ